MPPLWSGAPQDLHAAASAAMAGGGQGRGEDGGVGEGEPLPLYRLARTLQLVGGTDPRTALPAGAAGIVASSWASSVTVVRQARWRCSRPLPRSPTLFWSQDMPPCRHAAMPHNGGHDQRNTQTCAIRCTFERDSGAVKQHYLRCDTLRCETVRCGVL